MSAGRKNEVLVKDKKPEAPGGMKQSPWLKFSTDHTSPLQAVLHNALSKNATATAKVSKSHKDLSAAQCVVIWRRLMGGTNQFYTKSSRSTQVVILASRTAI